MSKLIIVRGNSGSGKSTAAFAIAQKSKHKIAVIEADYYRERMLFPKGECKEDVAALMFHNIKYCLDQGYHVIWDSIFFAHDRNRASFREFFDYHPEDNFIFNFDVSFEETAKRHQTRQSRHEFSAEQMRDWYKPVEPLGYDFEHIIPESNTLEQTVTFIKHTAGI